MLFREVENKIKDHDSQLEQIALDVEKFDGNNDVEKIKNAINYCTNETLTFKKGKVYNITENIVINKPIKINFNNCKINYGNLALYFKTGTIGASAFIFEGQQNLLINGLEIYNGNFEDIGESDHTYPIFIRYCKNIKIDNMHFTNINNGMCIMAQGVKKIEVKNISGSHCMGGVQIMSYGGVGCEKINVENVDIEECFYNQSVDIEALDTVNYPTTQIVPIYDVTINNVKVKGNTNDGGITCLSANNVLINNCKVKDMKVNDGIILLGCNDVTLFSNYVTSCNYGVRVAGSNNVKLIANDIQGNKNGTVLYDNASNTVSNIKHILNKYDVMPSGVATFVRYLDGENGLYLNDNKSINRFDNTTPILSIIMSSLLRLYPQNTQGSVGITNFEKNKDLFVIDNNGVINLTDGVSVRTGGVNPEGQIVANPGSLFLNPITGKMYLKQSGTGNIGWIEK